jgi:hypothetical protein
MFGLQALHPELARKFVPAIRYLNDGRPDMQLRHRRQELITAWRHLLRDQQVDVALAAIHRFEAPGLDGYWQRYGIASASAALHRGLAVGAAHFRRALPAIEASTLAAAGVEPEHLKQGLRRRAHRLLPVAAFALSRDDRFAPTAVVRLIED